MSKNDFYLNLDIDGVVGDYNATFRRYASKIMGVSDNDSMEAFPDPTDYSFVKSGWFPNVEIYKRVHEQAVNAGMFREMDVFPGAVLAINRIQQAGVKIRVCTSRFVVPKQNATVIRDTAEFVDRHAIPVDSYVFCEDKRNIRSALSIDDSPSNIDSYLSEYMNVIVFAQDYNLDYEHRDANIILRSNDWARIADTVIENYQHYEERISE